MKAIEISCLVGKGDVVYHDKLGEETASPLPSSDTVDFLWEGNTDPDTDPRALTS